MDRVNQKMKKFNLRGVFDGLRSSVSSAPKADLEIEETLRSEHFQVAKIVCHGFPHQPTAMAYDPVQHLLAIGTKSGSVRIFGRPGVDCQIKHDGDPAIIQILFLINEGALVTITEDDCIHLWNLRQKKPEVVHTLKFQRERITIGHIPLQSKWLYIGTERGNVHIINIECFALSGYIINWNKAIELTRKTHPGPVVHLSDNPMDPNKMLIGFETGAIVLWDLKTKTAEARFNHTEALRAISWHHEGKQFMCCHTDGSLTIWNIKTPQKPQNILMPHAKLGKDGKPEPCRAITKVQWKTVRNSEPYIMFSGGMPYDRSGRCPSLTVMHAKSTTVLEMEHDVVDFMSLCSTPWNNDFQDPYGIVVLLQNDLVVVDLTTPGYPCFENPYPMDIHESPVTGCLYVADCPPDLIPAFYSVGSKQKKSGYSEKEWPVMGGEWGTTSCSYPEIVITGHADGSLKFWDASAANLQILYKLKTAKMFDKSKCQSPDADDDPFAIQHIQLCVESRLLCVAGLTHTVLFRFSKQENSVDCQTLDVSIVYEIYDELDSPVAEYPPVPPRPNLGSTHQSSSVGSYSSIASDGKDKQSSVAVRSSGRKWSSGYQPELCILLNWIEGEPPPPITSLCINSSFGLLACGNECGIAIIDIIQKTCLLTMGTPDLYGSMDPYSRAPRSPKNKNQSRPQGLDGLSQNYTTDDCKSPTQDQKAEPSPFLSGYKSVTPSPSLETIHEMSSQRFFPSSTRSLPLEATFSGYYNPTNLQAITESQPAETQAALYTRTQHSKAAAGDPTQGLSQNHRHKSDKETSHNHKFKNLTLNLGAKHRHGSEGHRQKDSGHKDKHDQQMEETHKSERNDSPPKHDLKSQGEGHHIKTLVEGQVHMDKVTIETAEEAVEESDFVLVFPEAHDQKHKGQGQIPHSQEQEGVRYLGSQDENGNKSSSPPKVTQLKGREDTTSSMKEPEAFPGNAVMADEQGVSGIVVYPADQDFCLVTEKPESTETTKRRRSSLLRRLIGKAKDVGKHDQKHSDKHTTGKHNTDKRIPATYNTDKAGDDKQSSDRPTDNKAQSDEQINHSNIIISRHSVHNQEHHGIVFTHAGGEQGTRHSHNAADVGRGSVHQEPVGVAKIPHKHQPVSVTVSASGVDNMEPLTRTDLMDLLSTNTLYDKPQQSQFLYTKPQLNTEYLYTKPEHLDAGTMSLPCNPDDASKKFFTKSNPDLTEDKPDGVPPAVNRLYSVPAQSTTSDDHPPSLKSFVRRVSKKLRNSVSKKEEEGPKRKSHKFEMIDLTAEDVPTKPPCRKLTYRAHLNFDKSDGSFSRSRSSSMSSLENVSKEAIQCLAFADSYARKTESYTCPCLWVGTILGSVLVISISFPDESDRKTQPVIVSPSGTIFRLKGTIQAMSFLDCNGILIPALAEQWRDISKEETAKDSKKAYNRQQSVASMKSRMSPTSSQEMSVNTDRQLAILCSEKQARVIALPSQTCAYKVKITDTSVVAKAEVIGVRDSVCLGCYLANGHLLILSLPSLKPLIDVDHMPVPDVRIAKTFCFSHNGHAMYFCSPTELQKITFAADTCENLKDMLGELFLPTEAPEAPKQNFFKNLFGAGQPTLDREELFGEGSGKASKGIAKYTAGMGGAQERVGAATSEIGRAKMLAIERGERLGELDERTEKMRMEAESYSGHARELMQKYKDKKWYQF